MSGFICKVVKSVPLVGKGARALRWKVKSVGAHLRGTAIHEQQWRQRERPGNSDWDDDADWITGYWNSRWHSHRGFLADRILAYEPASVMEMGCNCGPNLFVLRTRNRTIKLMGIDINQEAIDEGRRLFHEQGMEGVELHWRMAGSLSDFLPKSVDIVFTDAVLMYVGPDKIKSVLEEMFRLATKAVVVLEWHEGVSEGTARSNCTYIEGHWKRDYANLFRGFVPDDKIVVTKLPEGVWPGRFWDQLGYVIEARL